MKSYLLGSGYQQLTADVDFSMEERKNPWGVNDDITFEYLYRQIKERDTDQPWHTAFLTLSSHEPFEVPYHRLKEKIPNAFASPPEVYFNGNKISEIQLNGDGQKIKLPSNLIKKNQVNEITIKTGRNLMQTAYVDYDDIEFMNLIIEN